MLYYALIDENGVCTNVFEVPSEFSGEGYVQITKEMYEDPATIGRKYVDGKWEDITPDIPDLGILLDDISETDLDGLIKSGFFFGCGMENAPGDGFFYIVSLVYPDGYNMFKKQMAFDFESNDSYSRVQTNGTWTAWS